MALLNSDTKVGIPTGMDTALQAPNAVWHSVKKATTYANWRLGDSGGREALRRCWLVRTLPSSPRRIPMLVRERLALDMPDSSSSPHRHNAGNALAARARTRF